MTTLFSNGYAIFIGVGADLPITTKDAQALHDLFVDSGRAAYSPDRVKLLIEENATKDNILTTLDMYATMLSQDPNATMIVYFSGHGGYFSQTTEAREYFLLPHDYDPDRRKETTISGDIFTRKIEALEAKRLIVFLDCCHAGGIFGAKGPGETFEKAPLPPTLLRMLETGSGQGIIASSLEAEKSYYDASQSFFTACLLDALAGKGARKNDGFARFLDVILYLIDEVPKRALIRGSQHPFINKIEGVSDNFPLCYVDGGSEAPPLQKEPLTPKSKLSLGKYQRLEDDKRRFQEERSIHADKLRRFRNTWAIEASVSYRYQQEQQIIEEESRLTELDAKLDELEEQLAPSEPRDKEPLPVTDNQKAPSEAPEVSAHKEMASEMLLTEIEQQKLVDLLRKIPSIEYATVRHSLVSGLPTRFQVNIDFDKSCDDHIAEIVAMVVRDTTFRLPNGAFPVVVVIQNAMKRVAEQQSKLKLQDFLNTLQSRWGLIQDTISLYKIPDIFLQELHNFILQLPAVKYDLMYIYDNFDDYIVNPICEDMHTYLVEACKLVANFYSNLKQYNEPQVFSYRIQLTDVLQEFEMVAEEVEYDIDRFCITYGSDIAQNQSAEEREQIQRCLFKLYQEKFDNVVEQVEVIRRELTES
jgi:hypothetical protein